MFVLLNSSLIKGVMIECASEPPRGRVSADSFLSLLRERALCALYLYRSLDIKVTSLHNCVESMTILIPNKIKL